MSRLYDERLPGRRRSLRLPDYDYRRPGAYFITIVTYQRQLLLADPAAQVVIEAVWNALPNRFARVALDAFVGMPNHIHGTPGLPVWQRNYYEHVVRKEAELARVRQYVLDNPARWDLDPENPARAAASRRGDS